MSYCIRALLESMDNATMIVIAQKLIRNYDIHQKTGYPENIPIPRNTIAKQIVEDVFAADLELDFISLLIDIHENGYMGRKYPIVCLRDIIKIIRSQGYCFDTDSRVFVEDPAIRRTKNWGVLKEGKEYNFVFLSLDIVKNSVLVRKYSKEVIRASYDSLRNIVSNSISKRNGRLWYWEGDGGLAAFYSGRNHWNAAHSGLEVLYELFLYNKTQYTLDHPLQVRIAVYDGPCRYSDNTEIIKKSEIVKKITEMESQTEPDSVIISANVLVKLDPMISCMFQPVSGKESKRFYFYTMRWEDR